MAIFYDEHNATFYLEGKNVSYVIGTNRFSGVHNLYFGKKIGRDDLSYSVILKDRGSEAVYSDSESRRNSPNHYMNEYPVYGKGDFRESAFMPVAADGDRLFEPVLEGYEITDVKPKLDGMPMLKGGQTLIIKLLDEKSNIRVKLFYTVYDELNVVARRTEIENLAFAPLTLDRVYSFNCDFQMGDYKLLTQYGAHMRERQIEISSIPHGVTSVDSKRGATSLFSSCFMALLKGSVDENHGEVYGFNLIYSGSFKLNAEKSPFDLIRINGGINDFGFSWTLNPGETFSTPEAVLVYSDGGLGQMSRTYHDLYRNYLINERFAHELRPIVINNWEATYFNFDIPKLCAIIDTVKGSGINMFVLDDGWFGARDNDRRGLGDWVVNEDRLKGSLKTLIDYVHDSGMKFGLWFEPEMVNPDSDIFRAHPDWIITVPGRTPSPSRDQQVFDLSKKEVRDYIVKAVSDILNTYEIDYVKWDMNRNITEIYSDGLPYDRQREIMHRYALGLYDICERIINGFPKVFFEGCSSGGGRFDPAMLYYFPQIWTSDNTDASCRTRIQYGTSLCYPLSSMSCHVSICPNHGTNRTIPFKTRGDIARLGATGYELDTTKITLDELAMVKSQVEEYHRIEKLVIEGDLYRLDSPFTSNFFAIEITAKDKSESVITCFRNLEDSNMPNKFFYPNGLDPEAEYEVEELNKTLKGSTIMNVGLVPNFPWGDFTSVVYHLKRV